MQLPIRGIQIALIVAFFADFIASSVQFAPVLTGDNSAAYEGAFRDYAARYVKELAYAAFFLGEAVLIELLYRIWLTLNANRASRAEADA